MQTALDGPRQASSSPAGLDYQATQGCFGLRRNGSGPRNEGIGFSQTSRPKDVTGC